MNLTEKAAAKIRAQHEFEAYKYLRVGVKSGGCSGFQYSMYWDDASSANDIHAVQHGVSLIIDHESLPILDGAILDYKEGLMNSGYVFTNPNSSRSCGCGKSFS